MKLGLLWATLPLSVGVGEVLWRRQGADTAMMWMSVAAGIVFAAVTLAYSQGFAAGRSSGAVADEAKRTA